MQTADGANTSQDNQQKDADRRSHARPTEAANIQTDTRRTTGQRHDASQTRTETRDRPGEAQKQLSAVTNGTKLKTNMTHTHTHTDSTESKRYQ